jgi:hypothetical protein
VKLCPCPAATIEGEMETCTVEQSSALQGNRKTASSNTKRRVHSLGFASFKMSFFSTVFVVSEVNLGCSEKKKGKETS